MSRILIACGGTGGHLAPGIAIAEVLQSRGHDCTLLISQKQVDSALIEKYSHLNFYKTPGQAFSGGITRWITSCWSLLSGYLFSSKLVKQEKPDLVLLFGGFLSVGLGLAARFAGVPVAVHEANCRPGKAVRLLKYLATRVYLPDGVRLKGLPSKRVRYLGYPVRGDVKHRLKAEAWQRLGITVSNKLLVLIGGSQGAAALNDWVTDHFDSLAKSGVSVYCVTGLGKNSASSIQGVSSRGEAVSATFVPFSDQMGDVISAADLVISRAGAGSIAEIIRCRAPSILIPYPYAADDHQQANALMHERHGAGLVLAQDDLGKLMGEVKNLIFNDWMLSKFKSNLERLDRFDSGARIATDIEDLCAARALAESDKQGSAI
ncbi:MULTISPECIES: glycosyltransferase [unclassified Lentimonas]|uniref:UDP-N-acetylglucosamine--N-acetylmuramyl- (pentapeptide) pyrophosphoryl-undecaprenol N-acetylglucosamine transferase n=1 Tax=unclassified Lentimonas TaxID=2630993 RepID=UPI00132B2A8A|nr:MULTISPECIES: UDP-N-acetylglucosamine--N-acetylmuramyl-(pentapeptide) pyrophosphoryl-undecaprenol N-acetylglucosamine transferase [unclassified Lentimonas]CAA6678783.1 UDP-N-acetylglucosamine--N-acetylmuramyl-(pentapeptide) pyrophosphoryl-undecaprenol N-acetylglucosamine transferase (EC [Lentimonas sp. CC4]CAA6684386.1 UDP-N-acetylglucosamine--N-acetylmuramyl-(pentapeptide) pyrophosphoryl-undecaprenol N-acetylglucosamine transferase (EC [Lentimonas sp. CC6]CAA6692918.1 UDP-N-acetylglucosamine